MKIKYSKTKLMNFNPARTKDFYPRFLVIGKELKIAEESKILGLTLKNDLSWSSNTEYMVKRAYEKLWCLRRLKKFRAMTDDLLEVYIKANQMPP